ncbi:MAG TPA: hypothetical protein VII47_03145 [Actinomycetota bacterium]
MSETIEVDGVDVQISNPDKVFFPPLGEAPYPPHFPKAEGEPARVQPSKARGPNAGRSKARRSKGSEAKDSQP